MENTCFGHQKLSLKAWKLTAWVLIKHVPFFCLHRRILLSLKNTKWFLSYRCWIAVANHIHQHGSLLACNYATIPSTSCFEVLEQCMLLCFHVNVLSLNQTHNIKASCPSTAVFVVCSSATIVMSHEWGGTTVSLCFCWLSNVSFGVSEPQTEIILPWMLRLLYICVTPIAVGRIVFRVT